MGELRRKCEDEAKNIFPCAYCDNRGGFNDVPNSCLNSPHKVQERITEALLQREMEIDRLDKELGGVQSINRQLHLVLGNDEKSALEEIKSLQEKLAVARLALRRIASDVAIHDHAVPLAKEALQQIGEV